MRRAIHFSLSILVILSTFPAFGLEVRKLVLKPNRDFTSHTPLSVGLANEVSTGKAQYVGSIFPMNERVEDEANLLYHALEKARALVAVCEGKMVTAQVGNLAVVFAKVYLLQNCDIMSEEKFLRGN